MTSLRARLFIGVTVFVAAFGVCAGILSFRSAFDEAIEFQDGTLLQVADFINDPPVHHVPSAPGQVDDEAQIIVEELGQGRFPLSLTDGLHTVTAGDTTWRVFVRSLPNGKRIAAAQPTAVRDELARDSAIQTLLPLAVLIPCLMILVAIVIRLSLQPVSLLTERLDAQDVDHLLRLPKDNIPKELQPFVDAINRLIDRLEAAFIHQQRFIADAAHELRSPVTALSLQVQTIDSSALPPAQKQRFDELRAGMSRVARLLDQLLSLSRYESVQSTPLDAIPFDAVLKEHVAALMPDAEARHIDLGFRQFHPVTVKGDAPALAIVVRNLLDNAVRHAPDHGQVDLSLTTSGPNAVLEIEDNGPGIPEGELPRVFEPFFRGTHPTGDGNGLGLSIVQRVLARFGGTIELTNVTGVSRSGLRVVVTWPAA